MPLRLLLADTLPAFAENLALQAEWNALYEQGIIRALQQGGSELKQWYNALDCQTPKSTGLGQEAHKIHFARPP